MDGLLTNPVIVKLQQLGERIGRNKFISSLQAGMQSLMGVIMVGAIFQIINTLLGSNVLKVLAADSPVAATLNIPYQFTINMLALWVIAFMSYHYATVLELKSPVVRMGNTIAVFLLTAGQLVKTEAGGTALDFTYFGAQGMFIGFFIVYVCIQVERLCATKNITIRMPDAVPPFLQNGFSAIIPLLISMTIFLCLNAGISAATGGAYTLCSGFMALLQMPLSIVISVPGMFVLATFGSILWCFGIHGSSILNSLIMPVMFAGMASNAEAMAAGEPLVFYPAFLFTTMSCCGGAGNTLPLVLMGLRSKSEQIRSISKASLVPGLFMVNEPVIFGMPIMYNPILCIPYIVNQLVVMFLTYLAYQAGFLTPFWIITSGVMPLGFATFFRSLDWHNPLWDILMFLPAGLVWFPFFKAYEKQLVAREAEAVAEIEA